MNSLKVAVGMSGGVDSGVAAKLLVDAGYDVSGVHLHFWAEADYLHDRENKCCSTESLMAARQTCDALGIPFYTFNFEDVFKETVVDYFLREYMELRTPNPCIVCNRLIKTGRLVHYVQSLGFDLLATGHYIQLVMDNSRSFDRDIQEVDFGSLVALDYRDISQRQKILHAFPHHSPLFLKMGRDVYKDQSYFLYTMQQADLVRLVFPLADFIKDDVRKLAVAWNLPVASSKESFDICFISGKNYRDFLMRYLKNHIVSGDVVTLHGEVIGRHDGLPFYSIGQRRGFTTNKVVPYYVVGFNKSLNQLIVGRAGETERRIFVVNSVHFACDLPRSFDCDIRLRHMGSMISGSVHCVDDVFYVELDVAQRSITPGQSAVFYRDGVVLGGGVIDRVVET